MRLIDLDDLLKFPIRMENYDTENGNEHFILGIESVLEYAEHLPTVDAVPVVRCKDCKSAYINSFSATSGVAVCRRWSNAEKTIVVQHDDFCSYGERREE